VRAALQMQTTIASLTPRLGVTVQMRIGVNTGEAVVGAMRAGGEVTVMGDVVNTAQRLQKLAAPGEVIVGPATYAATRDVIAYDALGPQGLPGREAPVEAFRATSALTPPGRRREHERSPFLGRDAELGALVHVLSMSARQQRAHFVLLSGDAGVGKSRLATEVTNLAAADYDALALWGQCIPYGDANAYGPIAEALREHAGLVGDIRDPVVQAAAARRVAQLLDLAEETPEVARVVEGLVYIIEGVARPGVDPTRARDDALRSVIAFLDGLSTTAPVVLTISDVHWASDEVLELCDRLLERLHNRRFVLVATTRPGLEARWTPRAGRHNALTLHLEPLDEHSTAELVRALLCDTDEETVAFLLERSGGNPFFVEELVAFVQETRGGAHLRELPATLHGLVAARLDTLEPDERSLLEDCAVVGGSGPVSAVLALAGRTGARDLLDDLVERDLLHIERDEFHFKSELIREIAYGTLTKAERARRHAVVAPFLAARGEPAIDQTAHHLATAAELVAEIGTVDRVPDDVRDQAIDALLRAAERDESVESYLHAEQHYDRVLGLLADENTAQHRHALLGRAGARVQRRVLDHARTDILDALEAARAANDVESEARALTLLGESEAAVGAYDIADATLGEALDLWRSLDNESGAAGVLRGLGMTHLFRGELIEAERFVSEALGAFRSAGNQRGAAWALQNLAWISFSSGNTVQAERRLEESADLFGELGDWGGLGWAYGLLSFVRYQQGRLEEAAAIAEHIAIEGRETGNRWAVGMMDVLMANVALWTGHTRECIERGEEAMALFQDIGDAWGEINATGSVLRAYAELGEDEKYERGLAHLGEVVLRIPDNGLQRLPAVIDAGVELQRGNAELAAERMDQMPDDTNAFGAEAVAGAQGLTRLQLGDALGAIAALEPCYDDVTDDGARMSVGSRLAIAYAVAHRPEDACAVLDDLRARTGGTYSDRMFALWAEALVQMQTGEGDARASVDAAHAIATATDARLEHAIAALARAKVLAALDEPDADDVADDADRQLKALGLAGTGWARVFDDALAPVAEPA
jgi:tetratricopeptide (TPR) repeat protein